MSLATPQPPVPASADAGLLQAQELSAREQHFVDSLKREHPTLWLATLIGPLAVSLVILLAVLLLQGPGLAGKLAATATVTFFLLGRFVIVFGGSGVISEFSSASLMAMLTWMDLMVAVVLVFHAGFLFRIPFLGRRLLLLVEDGQFILKRHPAIRRATFVGLVAFVTFPLAATGSVGGAIFGRLLGLGRPLTLLAIAIGSLVGNGAMYLFADVLRRHVSKDNPLLFWGGVAVIAGLILLLNLRYRQLKKRAMPAQPLP